MKKIRKNNSQKQKRSYKNCRNLLSAPDERMAFGPRLNFFVDVISEKISPRAPRESRHIGHEESQQMWFWGTINSKRF